MDLFLQVLYLLLMIPLTAVEQRRLYASIQQMRLCSKNVWLLEIPIYIIINPLIISLHFSVCSLLLFELSIPLSSGCGVKV